MIAIMPLQFGGWSTLVHALRSLPPTTSTTDYILDETITLLQSRRQPHLIEPWLTNILASENCQVIWMNAERFSQVRSFFAKHADKDWSFTDCFSFCVMHERQIGQALASDHHFQQAGFSTLLGV